MALLDNDFTSVILNMFKELKESITMMSHQIENINEELEILQKRAR